MNSCDYCHLQRDLFPVNSPDYTSNLFYICITCKMSTFLCPECLDLRDQAEEYVNGHCIYETKVITDILNKITELQNRIMVLEG